MLGLAGACLSACGQAGSGASGGLGGNQAAASGGPGLGGAAGGSAGAAGASAGGGAGAAGASPGGSAGTAGGNPGAAGSAGSGSAALPALTVKGTKLQDPTGQTIVLRGSDLIDIGALYTYGGNSSAGVTARIDKLSAAGVQGHVVRLPVYPKIDYNGGFPYCSPLPYPVGTGPGTSCTPTAPMSAADYVSQVLKPAIDYATSQSLYVIIDHHQIDNATTGTSAADATTFWSDIAPRFASYANVIYEPFNEPIDSAASWAALKPVVQGWIDTIRAKAPNNIIIVPSMSYDQHPGDAASDPPAGTNLMYTAHVYPANWSAAFQNQVATAVAKAPVFMTEWGYAYSTTQTGVANTSDMTWGTSFETLVNANGASWTAWVADDSWSPSMFSDSSLTQLTDFGALVKAWLAAKAASDWVR